MKPTRMRRMGIAAALSAIALAAPMATAGAATADAAVAARPADTIIGPMYNTSAPATFINTNNQVSPGGNSSGDQVVS
jgi:hypothetical protein